MFCCLAYSVRIRVHMVADSARLRATALAHTKVSWTTMMRMSCHSLGLGGGGCCHSAVWRQLGAALGCLGDVSSMFWQRGGTCSFLRVSLGLLEGSCAAAPAVRASFAPADLGGFGGYLWGWFRQFWGAGRG